MYYTYSRWDGSQDGSLGADELLDALSDDLMADGDLSSALQRVMRWGVQSPNGKRIGGLQSLAQCVRAERQRELDRYNLDSLLDELQKELDVIVSTEREELTQRRRATREHGTESDLASLLEHLIERKEELLDALPPDPGGAMAQLSDYEFLSDAARERFAALQETLQQQVIQTHFDNVRASLQNLNEGGMAELKAMLHHLNDLLHRRMDGEDPDIAPLRQRFNHLLPPGETLDDMIAALRRQARQVESLLESLAPELRSSLEAMMQSVLRDDTIREELARMAEALRYILPPQDESPSYPFAGSASLSFEEALQLMRRLQRLDALESAIRRAQETGDLERLDSDEVRQLLGDEAYLVVDRLQHMANVLVEAGYVERRDGALLLTARGIRRIGQHALHDIFRNLKRDAFGKHTTVHTGSGSDRADDTKSYEFGDPFLLDLNGTLMNAVERGGSGSPVTLDVNDFDVFRTEYLTQASTVLMLDMSRSMPLRGCFVAAKKVALALNSLIRTQYPRDNLYIIGFSDLARVLRPESLHQITWGDYVYGTNMQHGFLVARRLLGRHKGGNKQIILITDGEPTAHFEGDRVHFSYPPTFRTFQETLREVKRCTMEGIVINTFMLERSHYLADFVSQMTRINRGRAFFATPERLGDYILVDYVSNRRATS